MELFSPALNVKFVKKHKQICQIWKNELPYTLNWFCLNICDESYIMLWKLHNDKADKRIIPELHQGMNYKNLG